MRKNILLSLFISFWFSFAFAQNQNNPIRVLLSQGEVSIHEKATKSGNFIHTSDTLVLGDSSYIALGLSSGQTLELTKAGTYSISELEKQGLSQRNQPTFSYMDFVIEELTKKLDKETLTMRYPYMLKTGGVICHPVPIPIQFFIQKKTSHLGSKVLISWELNKSYNDRLNFDKITGYKITFYDLFGETILQEVVDKSETSFLVDTNTKPFQENYSHAVTYIVEAVGLDNFKSFEQSLRKMRQRDREKYDMYPLLNESQTAIGKIILAKYLEENGLVIDAQVAYVEAIQLVPHVKAYQTLYQAFLKRSGLDTSYK